MDMNQIAYELGYSKAQNEVWMQLLRMILNAEKNANFEAVEYFQIVFKALNDGALKPIGVKP